jgi:hypothetical protein
MTEVTLLLRQVHPTFIQGGRVTSQAFRPTAKDSNCLSAYDGDMIDPEPAWKHYTEELGHASTGVLAVSVEECTTLDLQVRSDPAPFVEHALIDFGDRAGAKAEKTAKHLRAKATSRNWLFQAGSETE